MNIKSYFFVIFTLSIFNNLVAQGSEIRVKYHINPKNGNIKDNVYFKIKDTIVTYEKGWIETKKIGDKTFEVTITDKIIDTIQIFTSYNLPNKFVAGEIEFKDDDPSKIYFNPWTFKDEKEDKEGIIKNATINLNNDTVNMLNQNRGYISISKNNRLGLIKTYWSISPFTMPFAIRLPLNDSIRSQASADLNLGVGGAYNFNFVNFKNRGIKAKMTNYGFSLGLGIGFSKVSLNSSNTSLSTKPLVSDEDGLAFTIAPCLGLNLNGFHIVGFFAYDLSLTNNVRYWNYYKKNYIGLGLGVNISTIGNLIN